MVKQKHSVPKRYKLFNVPRLHKLLTREFWFQKVLPVVLSWLCVSTIAAERLLAQTERHSQITSGLGNFQFTDPNANSDAQMAQTAVAIFFAR
jgi:hypothetical protein